MLAAHDRLQARADHTIETIGRGVPQLGAAIADLVRSLIRTAIAIVVFGGLALFA
jgi:hypothetical protein